MKTLLIIFTVLAFAGCGDESPTKTQFDDFSNTYFPLHVGNEWQYETGRDDGKYYSYKVIGKKIISNKEYFVLTDNFFDLDTNYIRTDNGIQYFKYEDNRESPYRIFENNALIEETNNTYSIKTEIINDAERLIETKAGNFINYASVEEGEIARDAGVMFYYAKDIGMIYSWWFKGQLKLVYSKVKDVETGVKQ